MIKKADIVLLIILVIAGFGLSYWSIANDVTGTKAYITVAGKEYGTYDLDKDQEIVIKQNNHINKITISDGKVSMSFSDCKNQVCVKHKAIDRTSESIVCLPNKVMVQIMGNDGGYDAISN